MLFNGAETSVAMSSRKPPLRSNLCIIHLPGLKCLPSPMMMLKAFGNCKSKHKNKKCSIQPFGCWMPSRIVYLLKDAWLFKTYNKQTRFRVHQSNRHFNTRMDSIKYTWFHHAASNFWQFSFVAKLGLGSGRSYDSSSKICQREKHFGSYDGTSFWKWIVPFSLLQNKSISIHIHQLKKKKKKKMNIMI